MGDLAIVATDRGWAIIDYADVENPVLLAEPDAMMELRDVEIHGQFAVFAAADDGVYIVDMANPADPVVVGHVETDGFAVNIEIEGSVAHVADHDGGLLHVDLSDPHAPVLFESSAHIMYCWDVCSLGGGYLAIFDAGWGAQIVDVRDPSSPEIVGSFGTSGYYGSVAARGSFLYISDTSGREVQVVDVSEPADAFIERVVPVAVAPMKIAFRDDRILATSWGDGYLVAVATNPTADVEPGTTDVLALHGVSCGLVVRGDHAFVAGGHDGILAVDLRSMRSPAVVGTIDSINESRSIAIRGRYAYIAENSFGFQIVDILDPARPQRLRFVDTAGRTQELIQVANNLCVVMTGGDSGIGIYDISDPLDPVEIGMIDGSHGIEHLEASGQFVFGSGQSETILIDLRQPDQPAIIGEFGFGGGAITISGDWLYTMGEAHDASLVAVDISSPENPVAMGSLAIPGWVGGLGATGSDVYVCSSSQGLIAVDASDPSSLAVVAEVPLPCGARFVAIDGDLAYVAQVCAMSRSAFTVFDISESGSPHLIGSSHVRGWATDIDLAGRYVATTLYDDGLGLFNRQCEIVHPGSHIGQVLVRSEGSESLRQNYPNPFNPITRISFDLPSGSHVGLKIHDARGMVVRTLVDGRYDAGTHDVIWDGRDGLGRPAAAGLYFYRLVTEDGVSSRKMILAK